MTNKTQNNEKKNEYSMTLDMISADIMREAILGSKPKNLGDSFIIEI